MWRMVRRIGFDFRLEFLVLLPGVFVRPFDGFECSSSLAEIFDCNEVHRVEFHDGSLDSGVTVVCEHSDMIVGCPATESVAPENKVEDVELSGGE